MPSPEHAILQSVAGAAVPPLFVTSDTSPQTNMHVRQGSSSREECYSQHWSLYSIPAAGYPKVEHRFRQFVAVLLFVRVIMYNGNTRPPAGSLMIEGLVSCGSEYSHLQHVRKALRILPIPGETRRLHRRYGQCGHTTSRSVNRQPIRSATCFTVICVQQFTLASRSAWRK
jgi:hypothetical protein